MIFVCLTIGLIAGSMISFMVFNWAYRHQLSREKRVEIIKRELDEEEQTRRLLHPGQRIYKIDNGGNAQIIGDEMTCSCYLASAKDNGYGLILEYIVQREDIQRL